MNQLEKSQDLRARRTRKMLQDAFMALLKEQSFAGITVQDITGRAMVNRATFYDHFVDKYALFEQSITEWFRQMLDERIRGEAALDTESLRQLILLTCEFLSLLRNHCMPKDQAMLPILQTTITDLIADVLARWMEEAHAPIDAGSLKLASTVTSWAIYGAAVYWSQESHRETLEDFVRRVQPLISMEMYGLRMS
jgi:AcrR family transcriptional regulator